MCLEIWIKQEKISDQQKWAIITGYGKWFPPRREGNNNCKCVGIGLENPDTGKYTHI